jgi:hypothetical protein
LIVASVCAWPSQHPVQAMPVAPLDHASRRRMWRIEIVSDVGWHAEHCCF